MGSRSTHQHHNWRPAVSRNQDQDIANNSAEGRNPPAILAPVVDDDVLDDGISGITVRHQCAIGKRETATRPRWRLDPAL
jgi:hypothetical protein